jgi:hypothetical protein
VCSVLGGDASTGVMGMMHTVDCECCHLVILDDVVRFYKRERLLHILCKDCSGIILAVYKRAYGTIEWLRVV